MQPGEKGSFLMLLESSTMYITAIDVPVFVAQTEEVVNMNGEKIENASEEEESEDVDSEETEEPVSALEETSEPISQVGTENHFLHHMDATRLNAQNKYIYIYIFF